MTCTLRIELFWVSTSPQCELRTRGCFLYCYTFRQSRLIDYYSRSLAAQIFGNPWYPTIFGRNYSSSHPNAKKQGRLRHGARALFLNATEQWSPGTEDTVAPVKHGILNLFQLNQPRNKSITASDQTNQPINHTIPSSPLPYWQLKVISYFTLVW